MLKLLKPKKNYNGMFRYHILNGQINSREDEKGLVKFYRDRIGCLTLAYLLELDVVVDENAIIISSPVNGTSATLTFSKYHEVDFRTQTANLVQDMDSVIATKEMLVHEIQSKMPSTRYMTDFDEVQSKFIEEMKEKYKTLDWNQKNVLNYMFESSKKRGHQSRLNTLSLDEDMVISASSNAIVRLKKIIMPSYRPKAKVVTKELLNNEYMDEFSLEMQKPYAHRNNERAWIAECLSEEIKKSRFWEVDRMYGEITSHPEMF